MMSALPQTNDAVFAGSGASATLDRLAIGASGTVVAVTGDLAVRRRLLEMGLCRGVAVTLVRRAPLGDPIEFLVRGYHLSLRADQAAKVVVAQAAP